MTRLEAIDALLAKVEAGSVPITKKREAWKLFDIYSEGYAYRVNVNAASAYLGSLNAAKALHEAVLPGFFWQRQGFVMIVTTDHTGWGNGIYGRGRDDTNPARAWLIAILKALIAMEDDQ